MTRAIRFPSRAATATVLLAAAVVFGAAPAGPAYAATGSDLCAQVGYNAGWRDSGLVTAVAVGLAESSCRPDATNYVGPGSVDRGLWQINSYWHSEVSDVCAYDAQCNANAAYRISSGGSNWSPWVTYNTGAYLSHLDEAQAAVERLNPTPSLPARPICRPVTGDWNNDGRDGIGVACKSGAGMTWNMMNGVYGGSPQVTGGFGNSDYCLPVTGDWDGNGTTTIGDVCKNGVGFTWYLSNGYAGSPSYTFGFGNSDLCWPVTGDWTGAGHTGIGVACKNGHGMTWNLMNGPYGGSPQIVGGFGNSDYCHPVTGDWDGNGTTTIGVACKSGAGMTWDLSNGFSGSPSYSFGFGNSDVCFPVTGDWNGTTDGSRRTGIGVACHSGHGLTWNVMYGPYGGSPQATAGFGNGDYYQPTGGYGGPTWPAWPNG